MPSLQVWVSLWAQKKQLSHTKDVDPYPSVLLNPFFLVITHHHPHTPYLHPTHSFPLRNHYTSPTFHTNHARCIETT